MNELTLAREGRMSRTSAFHFIKLAVRVFIFVAAVVLYIIGIVNDGTAFGDRDVYTAVTFVMCLIFSIEILFRLFPRGVEGIGCLKHLARGYKPRENASKAEKHSPWRTLIMVVLWLGADGFISVLYLLNVIDEGLVILYCLLLGVLDVLCILFFCPFQSFVMKNKCCSTCRIYNWDYIMIFSPLVFLPGLFTKILVGMSALLFVVWEVLYRLHPERFSESTNEKLSCAECSDKACVYKKRFRKFVMKKINSRDKCKEKCSK